VDGALGAIGVHAPMVKRCAFANVIIQQLQTAVMVVLVRMLRLPTVLLMAVGVCMERGAWSDCADNTQSRSRMCDKPSPQYDGKVCVGDATSC